MIATNLYKQDVELHSCIDRWEEDFIGPSGLYITDPRETFKHLPEETQASYIRWVFFLVQTNRL